MSYKTNLVITGGVGVGKSTTIECLSERLGRKALVVPEYIAEPGGPAKLESYLCGEITAYEFQQYILGYYSRVLAAATREPSKEVVIFERIVDDSVEIFGELDYSKGNLALSELESLRTEAGFINKSYNLPSYTTGRCVFATVDTAASVETVCDQITSYLEAAKGRNLIIGLQASTEVCYRRMLARNRPGEADAYTPESLEAFNQAYQCLYKRLKLQCQPL